MRDRNARLRAIRHLAKMGDRRALDALRVVARAGRDVRVREAAVRAIMYIESGQRGRYRMN